MQTPTPHSSLAADQRQHAVREWLNEVKRAGCWYGIPAGIAALLGYPLYWAGCWVEKRVSAGLQREPGARRQSEED